MIKLQPSAIAASVVLAVAAVAGVAAMGLSQIAKPKAVPLLAETTGDKGKSSDVIRVADKADRSDRSVRVDAPGAKVDVRKDTGKVSVKAPYTNVKVDPDKGQVRVRAPHVDLNIRW